MMRFKLLILCAVLALPATISTAAEVPVRLTRSINPADVGAGPFDLVVVGGTPGGIACAVRAAREGLEVLLVNRHRHLGGIVTSGLGVWDTQFEGHRSPLYDEVRAALFEYYKKTYGADSQQYRDALPGKSGYTNGRFEPKVAEHVLNQLVNREAKLTVLLDSEPAKVERQGALLRAVVLQTASGAVRVQAAAFVDATYEGDLAALAKAPYRIGREARSEYNEPHAGIVFMRPSTLPTSPDGVKLAALHDSLQLRKFTGWQDLMPESTGAADKAVQACNYRTMLTSDSANRVAIDKPKNYAPYFLKSLEIFSGVDAIPGGKFGWNRPQLIGLQTAYVEADAVTRRRLEDEHWEMTLGLLYFLQNDLTVPELVRRGWQQYGLAKDEFVDNGHRPYEMYIREARRIVGRAVFTEHDATLAPGLLRAPVHGDAIATTEWYMDSHTCTLARTPGGLDEGKFMLHYQTFPGQIPYRSLLPQGIDNLLVPVCLSATHVAWGTVRLEPVWMQTGEAAGVAAALAQRNRVAPAQLNPERLVRELTQRQFLVSFFNDVDVASSDPAVAAAEFFGTQGFFHDYHARLSTPLRAATARIWADGLKQLLAGKLDPAKTLLAVHQAEQSADAATLSQSEFMALLPKPAVAGTAQSASQPLTRGEALRLLALFLP